jgi:tetratricopeptide (TPR) repeat protein/class 3 adenylate cyclase
MIRYIPPFILQNYEKKILTGSLKAYVLLLDIVDFTKTGTALQKEGKQGAEELSRFLDIAFGVPIEMVTKHSGFVSLFAGDAFCAIFPDAQADNIISVVNSISSFFQEHETHKTSFGEFAMKIRQTLSYGKVDWQIYVNELQNEYVFSGDALKELVELSSCKEDVAFSDAAVKNIGESHFEKLEAGYRLISQDITGVPKPLEFHYSQETIAKFINPKYSIEKPQNEIRSAAYCFANLEGIEADKREQAIETIQNLADKYGGFVNKYDDTDKGLIAIILFGIPKSEDKTLDRICAFSLETVENLPHVALGIAAGRVFAGYTGSGEVKEYTALGHSMNLAERLMSKARAGEVLADTNLWQEMQTHYDFDYLGSLNLKGIALPLRYYDLNRFSKDKTWHRESRFVGREEEVTNIRNWLDTSMEGQKNSIIYIFGDAGIGKSRLVKEVLAQYPSNAYHKFFITCDAILPKPLEAIKQIIRTYFYYNPQLPDDVGIGLFKSLWSSIAMGDKELQRIESIIASLLGYQWEGSTWSKLPPDEKPTQLRNAFLSFMEQLTWKNPVLIHLDDGQWLDLDSLEYLQDMSKKSISPIEIVVSCRYSENGEKTDLELISYKRTDLELSSLTDNSSVELIRTTLRLENVPEETSNLIIDRAMGNPFFIEQLTSYLMEIGGVNDKGVITGDINHFSTFSISDIISSRIDRLTENVRECMFGASVLGMQFNIEVLTRMLNHEIVRELELGEKNRIWKDLDELCYIFSHILIKDVVYQRMMSDKLQFLHQIAAEAMEIVFADNLNENAEEIAHHFDKGNQALKASKYYDKAGYLLKEKCDFTRSEINLQHAFQIRETILGEKHPDTAYTLNNLAMLYYAQGKYEQAEPLFTKALQIRETVLGQEDPDTAISLINLAIFYKDQDKFEQAEQYYLKALQIREKVLGTEHPETASGLSYLGNLYFMQGKFEQAESLYLRALKILEKVLSSENSDTAATLDNLAVLYKAQGKFEQAEQLFMRALDLNEKRVGTEHPSTASVLNNLADLYQYQGKYEKAEPLYLKAMEIREKVLGEEHPVVAFAINNLATISLSQGKFAQAEQLFLRALDKLEKLLGTENYNTAITLDNLAIVDYVQGKYEQAELHYWRALKIFEKICGKEHPDTEKTLCNLADLYRIQGKYEQAEPLFLEALQISEKVLGTEHYETATVLQRLATLYQSLGKYEQAEPLYLRALKIQEKVFGKQHRNTATTLQCLASLYQNQGKYEQSEQLFMAALKIQEEVLGKEHPVTANTLHNIATLYQVQGKYDRAEPLYLQALETREKTLVLGHPFTIQTLERLVELYEKMGIPGKAAEYKAKLDKIKKESL